MLNRELVRKAIVDKHATQLMHSIVFECFINGLPFDKKEITKKEEKSLRAYTYDLVKSIGGIKALEAAIDPDGKSIEQNVFLANIYNICMEAAKQHAEEEITGVDLKSNNRLDDIINKSSLSEAEIKKFAKKADTVNLDEVSKVIKDKTLAVIRDEQDQYEKEKEIEQELKDSIAPADNEPDLDDKDKEMKGEKASDGKKDEGTPAEEDEDIDASTEAFINTYVEKNAPRHHVSLFSKLQDSAMEMMNITKVGDSGCDIFPIIRKVTFESFFHGSDSVDLTSATEAMKGLDSSSSYVESQNRPKMAVLSSMIMYSAMETMNTMGIYSPTREEIRHFISTGISSKNSMEKTSSKTKDEAMNIVKEACNKDISKMSSNSLGKMLENLKSVTNMTDQIVATEGFDSKMIDIASEATIKINEITNVLNQRNQDQRAAQSATESFLTKRQKSADTSQFNRLNSLFGKDPCIKEIELIVSPDNISSVIDVRCVNEAYAPIKTSFINMEYACEEDHYLEYLRDTFQKSNLSKCDKNVSILINDGKHTKIVLK